MLSALAGSSPLVESVFAEASEVLGYDLWKRCQEGPEEALNQTECTQPAMLAAGVATYRLWRERGGPVPRLMAGHSLGEFSARVAAGCLDFKDAVGLVKFRAEAMQAAVPPGEGGMAAILGLEDTDVVAACAEAAQGDVVEAVNFNAPGQVVIAGRAAAVARAIEAASAKGAKRALALPVSVPAHSSLMAPAAEKLRERLAGVAMRSAARIEVYGVDVKIQRTPDEIRAALVKQAAHPGLLGRHGAHDDRRGGDRHRRMRSGQGADLAQPAHRQESRSEDARARGSASLDEALARRCTRN